VSDSEFSTPCPIWYHIQSVRMENMGFCLTIYNFNVSPPLPLHLLPTEYFYRYRCLIYCGYMFRRKGVVLKQLFKICIVRLMQKCYIEKYCLQSEYFITVVNCRA
jgi:hypothetical protein